MHQALVSASVSSRRIHLQEAPFGGPPPASSVSSVNHADASSASMPTSSRPLLSLLRPMQNNGSISHAANCNPASANP